MSRGKNQEKKKNVYRCSIHVDNQTQTQTHTQTESAQIVQTTRQIALQHNAHIRYE